MTTRPHYSGTDHVAPEPGSRGWIRIIKRGCGGSTDYWGEFRPMGQSSQVHVYPWSQRAQFTP